MIVCNVLMARWNFRSALISHHSTGKTTNKFPLCPPHLNLSYRRWRRRRRPICYWIVFFAPCACVWLCFHSRFERRSSSSRSSNSSRNEEQCRYHQLYHRQSILIIKSTVADGHVDYDYHYYVLVSSILSILSLRVISCMHTQAIKHFFFSKNEEEEINERTEHEGKGRKTAETRLS